MGIIWAQESFYLFRKNIINKYAKKGKITALSVLMLGIKIAEIKINASKAPIKATRAMKFTINMFLIISFDFSFP